MAGNAFVLEISISCNTKYIDILIHLVKICCERNQRWDLIDKDAANPCNIFPGSIMLSWLPFFETSRARWICLLTISVKQTHSGPRLQSLSDKGSTNSQVREIAQAFSIMVLKWFRTVLVRCAMCDYSTVYMQDDVIKWKHFPRYWPFGNSPVSYDKVDITTILRLQWTHIHAYCCEVAKPPKRIIWHGGFSSSHP